MTKESAILATWDRVAPMLEPVLAEGGNTHTMEDLRIALSERRVALWPGERCVAVTEFVDYPQRRHLNVWLAAGDLVEMQQMRAGLEAYARAHGASGMQFSGRVTNAGKRRLSGWSRASGYEPRWIFYFTELAP